MFNREEHHRLFEYPGMMPYELGLVYCHDTDQFYYWDRQRDPKRWVPTVRRHAELILRIHFDPDLPGPLRNLNELECAEHLIYEQSVDAPHYSDTCWKAYGQPTDWLAGDKDEICHKMREELKQQRWALEKEQAEKGAQ